MRNPLSILSLINEFINNTKLVLFWHQAHITSPHVELSQAALQSLGFCVYYSRVVSGIPGMFKWHSHMILFCSEFCGTDMFCFESWSLFCHLESFASEILSSLCSLVVNSADKNTCTRALWVISKQSFPQDVVAKKVRVSSMLERSNLRGTAVVVGWKALRCQCDCLCCSTRSGVDCAGHAGECVASRGHPVCRHGTRGPECCHQVKEGSALVVLLYSSPLYSSVEVFRLYAVLWEVSL